MFNSQPVAGRAILEYFLTVYPSVMRKLDKMLTQDDIVFIREAIKDDDLCSMDSKRILTGKLLDLGDRLEKEEVAYSVVQKVNEMSIEQVCTLQYEIKRRNR